MFFSDIHTHLLYGVDDGATDKNEMISMVDAAYNDGTRLICATPHCCPDLFGNNRESIDLAFKELTDYCANKYPDLKLILGSELFYGGDGVMWLKNSLCKPLGGTKYVLVEFGVDEPEASVLKSIHELFNKGYIPIIAHAERYVKLRIKQISELCKNGVFVQVNSVDMRKLPFWQKLRLKKLLSKRLVNFVSTDTHGLYNRPPCMSVFYKYVSEKYGESYADEIFCLNAEKLFGSISEE